MKYYVCRRIRLYDFLSRKGYSPIQVRIDKDDPKRYVWIYEDNISLRTDIEEYYSRMQGEKYE